jgi:hypothetical protein
MPCSSACLIISFITDSVIPHSCIYLTCFLTNRTTSGIALRTDVDSPIS